MFLHFSSVRLHSVEDREQPRLEAADAGGGKPTGLWFTVGSDGADVWKSIASGTRLKFKSELGLCLDRIMQLSSVDQILALERTHGAGVSPHGRGRLNRISIASQFDGIIVAAHTNDCRVLQKICWYHEWHCASGCVGENAQSLL